MPRQNLSPETERLAPIESLRAVVGPRLGIDPRALGAFRIALGLLVLADLVVLRLPVLVPLYTDDGVFPRSALAEAYPAFAAGSIHALSGSAWVQGLLFAIAGCFAVFLVVGYRTRLATLVSLVLLASLHARNPHVVNGGDTILLTFLFLGLFLPLEAWSLGDQRRHDDRRRVLSIATATILLHFVAIYATNAVYKYQSEPWMAGEAVPRIFYLEEYFVLLGPHLVGHTTLLTAINWLWIALLTASPLLVVLTGRLRIALVAAFVSAQLGMAATMRLGVFPFVMITGLLLFLPPQVWDRVEGLAGSVTSASDWPLESAGSPNRSDAGTGGTTAVPPRVRRGLRLASSAVLVCFLVAVLFWQGAAVGVVDSPASELDGELSEVSWAFFAPNPPDSSSWFVVEAELESGDTVDAVDGGDVTFEPPPDVADTYPTTLWGRYGNDLRYAGETRYEPAAAYVCDRTGDDVASVTIYHVEQPVDASGPVGEPTVRERIEYAC